MELRRSCPLCGSATGHKLCDLNFQVFDDCPVSGHNTWVTCARCGFSFYDTPSVQADFDRYYEQNAYYCTTSTAGSGGNDGIDGQRFETLAERLDGFLTGPNSPVFDIGCGKGGLLAALSKLGYRQLYGVDPVPGCVQHVRQQHGLDAEVGSAMELPFRGIRPQLMVYSHILEHTLDLRALLSEAHCRLADDGLLYVEVPDASRYGEYAEVPYQDLYLEHVNHFGAEELARLLGVGGFHRVDGGRTLIGEEGPLSVPCLYALFRKGEGPPAGVSDLPHQLAAYVERCERHPLMNRLEELADRDASIYIWGISQHVMLLLGQTALARCRIRALIDRDPSKQQRTLGGRPVLPPEILSEACDNDVVVIGAHRYRESILASLETLSFHGSVVTLS